MSRKFLLVTLAAAAAAAALLTFADHGAKTDDSDTWAAREQARLEKHLLHAAPGSDRAFKAQLKLDRLQAWRDGRPQPGFPDEFHRVLYEMKIPSDRRFPEYEPGYLTRELAKAKRTARASDKLITWTSRGPGNVAGRAREILVHPSDPSGDTWYVASVGGGVWKTDNAGATWRQLSDEVPNLSVSALVYAPSSPNIFYAGTGESFYNVDTINGNGILKSTDSGETWTPLASTLDDLRFNNISRIIVSPTDANLVLASTTTGFYKAAASLTSHIFRSTDGGANWTVVHTETGTSSSNVPRILQLVADPTDFDIQYATVRNKGILKSTNGGLTWNPIVNGINDPTGRFELAVSTLNPNYLFASSEGGNGHSELWASWDGGATWNETFESGGNPEPNWLGSQGWYDNTIVCDPDDPTIVYVGGPELWQIDLGTVGSTSRTTSRLASYSFPHPDHHMLRIVPTGGGSWYLLGTNDGGMTRTFGGPTGFSMPIDGMVTTQFYGVDKRPGDSAYFGGMQDNGTWYSPLDPDELTPWTRAIGGDGYETSWHFDDPMKMIGGYQYNGLARTLDGGVTWYSAVNGLSDTGSGSAPFITKIGKSNLDPDLLFAVGVSGVWRSTDFGGSWNPANISASDWGPLSSFQDVRVSRADADIVWAGSRMDVNGLINVSTDRGLNFSGTSIYPLAALGPISGLATHPTEPNTAYAMFSYSQRPKIIKTTDLGVTWTDITGFGAGTTSSNGFPDVAVYDLLVWPNDTNRLWAGTEIGLVESLDGGATWALANNGLPAVGIWFIQQTEDEIILGTHGRGIWSMTDVALEAGQTYNPLFEIMAQVPSGNLEMGFNLRSEYDSTQVWVDGAKVQTIAANTRRQMETVSVPILASGTASAYAVGFKGGVPYPSITRQTDVYVLSSPILTYDNLLNNDINADDFQRSGFQWSQPTGFSNGALHSDHPYADGVIATAVLLKPIEMSLTTTLEFDHVAIVEPGEAGSVYGDSDFWDYAIVEATTDGVNWNPVYGGVDCREDPDWLDSYNTGTPSPGSALYRSVAVELYQIYDPGEVILLRFRLFADGFVNGWGWAIDNVKVHTPTVLGVGDVPGKLALQQNFPNPFNPSTTISYNLDRPGRVELKIFDARGSLVRTLIDEPRLAGPQQVVWDGRDNAGRQAAAGVYLYSLKAGERELTKKMTLVK